MEEINHTQKDESEFKTSASPSLLSCSVLPPSSYVAIQVVSPTPAATYQATMSFPVGLHSSTHSCTSTVCK